MAFLFKSKKAADKAQSSRDIVAGSQSSLNSGPGNGRAQSDKPAGHSPGSSVNNSMSSLPGGGTSTPSPEQQASGRRGQSTDMAQDMPVRNGGTTPVQQVTTNSSTSLYPWSQRRIQYTTSHPSPFPRYGAAVNSTASKEGDIYLMGGLISSSTVKGDLWMVEAGGNMACYPLSTTAEGPGPRVGHASLLVGNAFIVYGGDTKMDDSDVLDETLYLLNTSTRQWSRALPAAPRPSGRYGHSLNIVGSKIYVFGGQVEGYFMNDLVAFDLNQLQVPTNRWEILIRNSDEGGLPVGKVPPPRTNHSVVSFNDRLYLFGGTNGLQWFNDVWSFDPMANAWVSLDCIGYIPAPREGHAAAIVDDVMYIFGGRTEEGADLGDLAAFRISTRRWYTFQNMGPSPSPRSGHSMTAYGKTVVVLAGEPSTATEAQDLAIVYLLDTSKIRYPVDQQIQSNASGERVSGPRRPGTGDKSLVGPPRGPSREGTAQEQQKRVNGQTRESIMGVNAQAPRINGQANFNENDTTSNDTSSGQLQGPQGSKLPRASMAQASPGPPPQQAAPTPRTNGVIQNSNQSKSPGKAERGFGPPLDTSVRSASAETVSRQAPQARTLSPGPVQPQARESPSANGQPLVQSQLVQPAAKPVARQDSGDTAIQGVNGGRASSKPRQARQQGSTDSTTDASVSRTSTRQTSPPPPSRQNSNPLARRGSARNSQTVAILKELDAARTRNAWYASELELARKAGYAPNPSGSPVLDQRGAESFDDDDKPLIEALIAMRSELAKVQGSIDKQAVVAARKIAEVEKQRDAAVNEAVYAKAKLAAHGGSQSSTPQPDSDNRHPSHDRSTDISRKLAAAISTQRDLKNKVDILNAELNAERNGRTLAEETANEAQNRITDLESYKQHNSAEVERLKAELHASQKQSREESIVYAEAVATAKLLRVEKAELESRHREVVGTSRDQSGTFESLRNAITASTDRGNLLERKLNEERSQCEKIESKLRKLKTEHEVRTSELETTTKRLRDAEELAERHASEAQKHRQAVLSGLDRVASRDVNTKSTLHEERAQALQAQVAAANSLVRKYQEAADIASEKLRSAEERIAGLEAYQEQVSREGMSIRKQLQNAMREVQSLHASKQEMKYELANQQLETNAAHVQHNTLKDILVERGISPTGAIRARGLSSPSANGADQARLRDLEQRLTTSLQAHEDTKRSFDTQSQESERAYREKLTQLESDYQSAVHYVKGTEKMLKRMTGELAKYKTDNSRLKEQLVEAEDKASSGHSAATWEKERAGLNRQIESLQADVKTSVQQLERQLTQLRAELTSAQKERDLLRHTHGETQHQLSFSSAELAALQQENAHLEQRAVDAEQKVSLLLDQVEHSVDNYRRQSRALEPADAAAVGSHKRQVSEDASSVSAVSEGSAPGERGLDARNSMALDSLASELETLRSHWESTSKTYASSGNRLSGASSDDVAGQDQSTPKNYLGEDWRRGLDALDDPRAGASIGKEMGVGLGKENERTTGKDDETAAPTKGRGVVNAI